FFFQAEDGIRDFHVTGVQTCALPIFRPRDVGADVPAADGAAGPQQRAGNRGAAGTAPVHPGASARAVLAPREYSRGGAAAIAPRGGAGRGRGAAPGGTVARGSGADQGGVGG